MRIDFEQAVTMDMTSLDFAIETAFLGVERDEDCTLHQAQLSDQGMRRDISDAEWQSAKDRDPERDWRQVPAAALDECDAALSHATAQSWRFYLPAYMSRALRLLDADILSTWFPGSVIHHLTYPGKSPGLESHVLDRFKTLNTSQGQAVKLFLQYIRDYPATRTSYRRDAELALRKYWELDEERRPQEPKIILP
jgi:hypothetical protein